MKLVEPPLEHAMKFGPSLASPNPLVASGGAERTAVLTDAVDAPLARRPRARHRWADALLVLVILAYLAPIWAFRYFPSTDGPAHVANADVLLRSASPANGAAYHRYYEITKRPLPNLFGHAVLAGLMIVVPPLTAEKLLLSAYLIALPLAARYALRSIGANRSDFDAKASAGGALALLAVPLGTGYLLHSGFYNFCISLIFFLLVVGYWLRHREAMRLRHAVVLTVLSLLLFSAHLFALTMACVAIAVLTACFTAADVLAAMSAKSSLRPAGRKWPTLARIAWRGIQSRGLIAFYALLPALIIAVEFSLNLGEKPGSAGLAGLKSKRLWFDLLGLSPLVSYRRNETYCAAAFALLLALSVIGAIVVRFRRNKQNADELVAQGIGRWNRYDGLLALTVAFAFLYFRYSDAEAARLFIPSRLIVFTGLGLIFWLAAQPLGQWAKHLIPTAAAVIALTLLALHVPAYAHYNRQLAEFVSVKDQIRPGSTLLPLILSPRGFPLDPQQAFPGVVPFYSAAGFITAEKHVVDLNNYEAGTDHFPVRFRPEMNPRAYLARQRPFNGLDAVPPRLDLAGYESRTGGRIDYVLVWAGPRSLRESAHAVRALWRKPLLIPRELKPVLYPFFDTMDLYDQLEAGFEQVPGGRDQDDNDIQLWRRKAS